MNNFKILSFPKHHKAHVDPLSKLVFKSNMSKNVIKI